MSLGTKVRSVHVRRFRSLESAELSACGGLNIFIGKNNSGKSNLLATVDLIQKHLSRGSVAGPWSTARPQDEFTNRVFERPVQIGIEYDFPEEINSQLRELLKKEVPHLENPIAQIKGADCLSILLAGTKTAHGAFLFVQTIAVGSIVHDGDDLSVNGIVLLDVSKDAASQLFSIYRAISDYNNDLRALETLLSEPYRLQALTEKETARFYYGDLRPHLIRDLNKRLASGAKAKEEAIAILGGMQAEIRAQIATEEHRETETAFSSFAGPTKAVPSYAAWLIQKYGEIKLLHLKETREPVGREEAEALLRLKVTRGGPERLHSVQQTIKALLGVAVDAFQAEDRKDRAAEIDVDRFLVEANGAGVREALRLVLDLELKEPDLVLIEEPEVHLHPGLEHAVYQYLRDRSQTIQIFVTTHSTNFVDSISFQNIYLVSKDAQGRSVTRTVETGEGASRIPSELGLRLSTVFMYDRLVFVEGPSDEAVLREMCKTLDFDVASANVGFVQMGGVRNFAHFAAQATLDLLARRQVKMWFIADRDERDDDDVKRMMSQLGTRAKLHVLQRRELENYLMDPPAILEMAKQKKATVSKSSSADDVQASIQEAALSLHDEVVRLRLNKSLLGSLHLVGKDMNGSIEERLDAAIAKLNDRKKAISETHNHIRKTVDAMWQSAAADCAPGSQILEIVLKTLGSGFSKDNGDSARLARLLKRESIPDELQTLLREITKA